MAARGDRYTKLNRWRAAAAQVGQTGLRAPAVQLAVQVGIHLLLGAVLAGGVVFQKFSPFGVAMVAASGSGLCGAGALAGTCLGYLSLVDFSTALRYLSASILTFAVDFAFYDVKVLRRPWAMALVAGAMNGCTGFIYLSQWGWRTADVIYFLTEIAMTIGSAWCLRQVLLPLRQSKEDYELNDRRRFSLLVLVCCVLISLSSLHLWRDVSLGRALAALCAMAGAWKGGGAVGAALGVFLGLSMDLAGSGAPLYAMAFGLASLAAGACRDRRRPAAAGAFALTIAAVTMWTWDSAMQISLLFEVLLGTAVFLILPNDLLRQLSPLVSALPADGLSRGGQDYVRRQLEQAADAFHSLYESMRSAFRAPINNDADVSAVFDRAACRVCRRCTLRAACWERDYINTFNALNDATAAMLARGKGEAGDFPRHFVDHCLHFPAFLDAVNQELTALLYRRQYNNRLRESRMAVCRQYGQLSTLLDHAAAELSRELVPDPGKQRRLAQQLAARGLELDCQVFRDEYGRLRATLQGEDWREAARPDELPGMERALGVPLRAQPLDNSLSLVQLEPLMAVAGIAAKKKDGETVSGDAGTYFKREDGTLCVLLCDGMGSGPLASRESTLAVRLLEQFLTAGVDTEHALITLSSALALRGEEQGGFTTIDLLQIDLFSGEGSIYKLGAAPTYIRHGTLVRRVTGSALPAGLAAGEIGRPDCTRIHLEPGDCVLMVSDGVTGTGDDEWLRHRLADFQGDSPKELARTLITDSPEGATDDRTALVVQLEKRERIPKQA